VAVIATNIDSNYSIMMRSRLSISPSAGCMSVTTLTKRISVQFNIGGGLCADISWANLIVFYSDFTDYEEFSFGSYSFIIAPALHDAQSKLYDTRGPVHDVNIVPCRHRSN
jgi:hypothetical protein